MKKDVSCKNYSKKAQVSVLISDKVHFKVKKIIRDKEGRYLMIKESYHQEE